jgi:uncharacterized SAM-binding protein YcdF (DUF218 family)
MFIFLSKLLPLFVYPLGLACLLIVLALLLKGVGWQRAVLIATLALLFLGGNRWVSTALARSLEWQYLPPAEIPQAEVIVVLGGGTANAVYPRTIVEISDAGDRVLYAAWLYKQGKAPHLLLTGGALDWAPTATSAAQDMATLLEMMGVPGDALWLEPDSRNTYEDAVYSARILREKGIHRILLVTSAFHMPRSVRLFEAQGLEVIPLPADYSVVQASGDDQGAATLTGDPRAAILSLFPTADNLSRTTRMLKEYIGILVYDLKGWK